MTSPLVLSSGSTVEVEPPKIPTVVAGPPSATQFAVLPVTGPRGLPGASGGGVPMAETPAGVIDGVNTVFTTTDPYQPNSISVFLNGLHESYYTETGSGEITLEDPPQPGDVLRVGYLIL